MITSVFLSNNTVFVAGGSEEKRLPKRTKSIIYRMPEGSLLNGMITNEQELTEQLQELWREKNLPKKHVRLVLESSYVSVKTLTLPKIRDKEIRGIVSREFADMEQYEEKLYDYAVLQGTEDGGQEALAVMVNRSYIEGWQKIFEQIGVELERITVSRETMTRYFASCQRLEQGAYVLLLLDDMILTSVLWIDGRLVSADRKRIFAEAGSEDFYAEVSRSVSSIRQFYAAQKGTGKLTKLYLCGFREEDTRRCQESLDGFGLDMQVESFQEPCADNVMAAGGLLQAKKPINMLEALKAQRKADKSNRFSVKKAVPLIVLFVLCLVITGGLATGCHIQVRKAEALSEYLTDAENLKKKMQAETLKRDISSMEKMIAETDQVKVMKKSYPQADSKVTDQVQVAAGYGMSVSVAGYNASTGELRLKLSTPVVDNVNQYISALSNTGMFVEVGYSGYTYLEGEGNYQVEVSCILRGSAGK